MDSVSPNPSATSISHQPSSLSLNNVDDLKETNSINDRLSSSNPELDVTDEPEAVIVCPVFQIGCSRISDVNVNF